MEWNLYFPLLTTFLSSTPGVNLATLRAAILMVAPVCGFRPLRALRCETENVPNPIKATRSPLRRAAVTLSTAVSIAVVACAFEMLQAPAIRSTRSALFMLSPDEVLDPSAGTGESTVSDLGLREPFSTQIVICQWQDRARRGISRHDGTGIETHTAQADSVFLRSPQASSMLHRLYTIVSRFRVAAPAAFGAQ